MLRILDPRNHVCITVSVIVKLQLVLELVGNFACRIGISMAQESYNLNSVASV